MWRLKHEDSRPPALTTIGRPIVDMAAGAGDLLVEQGDACGALDAVVCCRSYSPCCCSRREWCNLLRGQTTPQLRSAGLKNMLGGIVHSYFDVIGEFISGALASLLEFVDAIPKSPTGKIIRRLLVESERHTHASQVEPKSTAS